MKPLIALTTGYETDSKDRERLILYSHYVDALRGAGAIPAAVPPVESPDQAAEALERFDGLLLIGGDDIRPSRWGEELHPRATLMHPRREVSDFALFDAADRRRMPILGICLGCQEINVARGGSLHQHLPDLPAITATHSGVYPNRARHRVRIEGPSLLAEVFGPGEIEVNSAHHQGVARVGTGLRVTAWSQDGLVEGLESDEPGRFLLAVQWHPEELARTRADMRELFVRFAAAAGRG